MEIKRLNIYIEFFKEEHFLGYNSRQLLSLTDPKHNMLNIRYM
jgi:hypothetical protein